MSNVVSSDNFIPIVSERGVFTGEWLFYEIITPVSFKKGKRRKQGGFLPVYVEKDTFFRFYVDNKKEIRLNCKCILTLEYILAGGTRVASS